MNTSAVPRLLTRLTGMTGVAGAMVVDAEVGVSVAAELATGVEETALAAMSGALYSRTADASRSAGMGALRTLQLEAGDGHLVMAGAGPLLVVVLAGPSAPLGLLRVEVHRAAGELSG